MLGRLIPLLPILFLLGGFFTGHIALLTAVIVLLYIIWVTYAERWLPTLLWWPVSLACGFTRASRCACATAQALARCA